MFFKGAVKNDRNLPHYFRTVDLLSKRGTLQICTAESANMNTCINISNITDATKIR